METGAYNIKEELYNLASDLYNSNGVFTAKELNTFHIDTTMIAIRADVYISQLESQVKELQEIVKIKK